MSDRPQSRWSLGLGAAFVVSIFASAFLLFMIQPVLARLLLPRFGGTPGVWNTAVVFFQAVLLLGYVYAHWVLRWLGERRLLGVHAAVLAASLLFLPPALGAPPAGPPGEWPVAELIASLTLAIGVPFFVLSTNSSLVQHWYAVGRPHADHDPYRLYAASNAGSLLALLGYPFLVEPLMRIPAQLDTWSVGYGVFVASTFAVLSIVRSSMAGRPIDANPGREPGAGHLDSDAAHLGARSEAVDEPRRWGAGARATRIEARPITWGRRLLWTARAAVAASLLLSVTVVLTTDIAPVPLLWVIPLAIYLVTFILAFGSARLYPQRATVVAALACAVAGLSMANLSVPIPLGVSLPAALATLFFGALLCHGDLALDRPAPAHLTEFYLWVAMGGVVGGTLNGIVAPLVLDGVAEYPLTLLALAVLPLTGPGALARRLRAWRPGAIGIAMPIFMLALTVWAARLPRDAAFDTRLAALVAPQLILVAGLVSLAFRRAWSFVFAVALAAAFAAGGFGDPATRVHQARSFFGVQRVIESGGARILMHGSTMHGIQSLDEDLRDTPGTYYHPNSPMGALVRTAAGDATIGIVGLGAGSLAALGKPGQTIVFHEIDPLVVRIAEEYFTFLDRSAADVDIVLGDGRLTLAEVPDGTYDILIVDAFSSDSVPAHLLTLEAFRLYRDKIAPDGAIMVHRSNRHVDIGRIVAGAADPAGLHAAVHEYVPTPEDRQELASATHVSILAPSARALDALVAAHGWTALPPDAPSIVWTDDHAPLLGALDWDRAVR